MARLALLFAAMTGAVFVARASAQTRPEPTAIAWVRSADAGACIAEPELVERVRARLGFDPFVADAGVRTLEGFVLREADELVATWVLRDPSGEVRGQRTVRSRELDCEALSGAAVLAAALAIDPDAALREPQAPPVVEPQPAPAPPPPPVTMEVIDDGIAAFVGLETGFLWGPLPSVSPLVGVRAALRLQRTFAIEARAFWTFEQGDAQSRYATAVAAVAASFAIVDVSAVRWELLAGAYGGLTFARAVGGLAALENGPFAWGGPFVGTRAELAVDVFRVALAFDAIVPLPRRTYAVEGSGRVLFTAEPLALSAAIAVGAEVP